MRRAGAVATMLILIVATACGQPRSTQSSPPVARADARASSTAAAAPTPSVLNIGTATTNAVATDCSSSGMSTRRVLERLFELSAGGNPRAITDCYTAEWRSRDPNFDAASERWSTAGPAVRLEIDFLDRANGCDRFRVNAQLANGERIGWSGARLQFYVVAPSGTKPRIAEVASALVRPDVASTTCP